MTQSSPGNERGGESSASFPEWAAAAFLARSPDFQGLIGRALAGEDAKPIDALQAILANVMAHGGQDEATAFLIEAFRQSDDLATMLAIANAVFSAAGAARAAPLWKEYIERGGDDIFAYRNCLQHYLASASTEDDVHSLLAAREVVTAENASFEFLMRLIDILMRKQDFERAYRLCLSVLEKDPFFPPALMIMQEIASLGAPRAAVRYMKSFHQILAFSGPEEAARRIDAHMSEKNQSQAQMFAELCGNAGVEFEDRSWLRWIFWPASNVLDIETADASSVDHVAHHALLVSTSRAIFAWPTAWLNAVAAIKRPCPLTLCLHTVLEAAKETHLLDPARTAEASRRAETPLEHFMVGAALRLNREWEKAADHLNKSLAAGHLSVSLYYELAYSLAQCHRLDEMERLFDRLKSSTPEWIGYLCYNIASRMWNACDLDVLYGLVSRPEREGSLDLSVGEPPFPLRHYAAHYLKTVSIRSLQAENEHFLRQLQPTKLLDHAPKSRSIAPAPVRRKPARVGYFFGMGNAFFQFPVLKFVDRTRFETYFYYHNVREHAPIHQMELDSCDVFRALGGMSDESILDVIRKDDVDLLIVLDCIALKARDRVLLSRPARRIAYYGNVFAPTGNAEVDAIFLPESMAACFEGLDYHEAVLPIPDWLTLVSTQLGRFIEPIEESERDSDDLVIGTAANTRKLTADWFSMVARVMAQVPTARLRIDAPILHTLEILKLHGDARAAGIDPDRLTVKECLYNSKFRERLARIDLALDSFPAGCYFSAIQALSAGVPLLAFPGVTPQGRGAMTVMNGAGVEGLLCATQAEMERRAVELLRNPVELRALRQSLPATMRASRFSDLVASARAWETALDQALALPDRPI